MSWIAITQLKNQIKERILDNVATGVSIESASYMENNNFDENETSADIPELNEEEYAQNYFPEDQSYKSDENLTKKI